VGRKNVVILQPQTGNEPSAADAPGAGENIDNDATGQTGVYAPGHTDRDKETRNRAVSVNRSQPGNQGIASGQRATARPIWGGRQTE
jgi:hypothetical protein